MNALILDSRRGGYVDQPNIEREILEPLARVSLRQVDEALEVAIELEQADVLIAWHHIELGRDALSKLNRCRGVVRASVGYDNIDLAFAARLGIPICNVPDYGSEEVADHTLALLLGLVRRLPHLHDHVRLGGWDWRAIGSVRRLRGARLGIVGFGRIGVAVARRAQAFGMRVTFFDPFLPSGIEKAHGVGRYHTLDELLVDSDIVTLHVPLNERTRHLIGARELNMISAAGLLINTSRGAVIDQEALVEAVTSRTIGGAGLDVLETEPEVPAVLRASDRVDLTPHAAFYADASLVELRMKAARAALELLEGRLPRDVVNGVLAPRLDSDVAQPAGVGGSQ